MQRVRAIAERLVQQILFHDFSALRRMSSEAKKDYTLCLKTEREDRNVGKV
jgi:hypothetical protein